MIFNIVLGLVMIASSIFGAYQWHYHAYELLSNYTSVWCGTEVCSAACFPLSFLGYAGLFFLFFIGFMLVYNSCRSVDM